MRCKGNIKLKVSHKLMRVERFIYMGIFLLLQGGCKSNGSSSAPIELSAPEVRQITGTISVIDGGQGFADFYNGTNWTIVDVDILVNNIPKGESRRMRMTCYKVVNSNKKATSELMPFSSGTFEGTCGDIANGLEKGEISYTIKGARGYMK